MANYRRVRISGGCYFFTLVTEQRVRMLTEAPFLRALRTSLVRVRGDHPFTLNAIVVLPDHLHMLVTLPGDDDDYPLRIQLIKRYFTRLAVPVLESQPSKRSESKRAKREAGLWQRRYWEHAIRHETDFRRHLEYIFYNPVKHGLVHRVVDWPYSSFHRYVRERKYPAEWAGDGNRPIQSLEAGE